MAPLLKSCGWVVVTLWGCFQNIITVLLTARKNIYKSRMNSERKETVTEENHYEIRKGMEGMQRLIKYRDYSSHEADNYTYFTLASN